MNESTQAIGKNLGIAFEVLFNLFRCGAARAADIQEDFKSAVSVGIPALPMKATSTCLRSLIRNHNRLKKMVRVVAIYSNWRSAQLGY
jgi:hypothetical protein